MFEERGIPTIVLRELRAAPRRLHVLLVLSTVYVAGMLAWALEKRGWESLGSPTTWGALFGGASGMLIGISFSLFTLAQEGRDCTTSFRITLRTRRMHPMLLALPVLCLLAAAFAAVAIGLIAGRTGLITFALAGIPTFAVLLLSLHGLRATTRFLYDHAREQAEVAARAREEASRSQLAMLQAQMNPHFLFNALNTVASLVRTDARRAEATVENLARILRRSLDRSEETAIPLADEIDDLRAYLSVEQARYGDRLAVDWAVDPDALRCRVPPMTLQPLVENSLKHGLSKRIHGGRVRIEATRRNGTLHLRVDDDGPGFPREFTDGTGLTNLRQRLATLYGTRARLQTSGTAGASVTVELPAEESA